ncbi:MAG: energy-coupling factor transporter transmembrane protein EcfT [Streptococcaceae bacterium]|jgi:energy-coupling factor transport system permease protein|nr:energy-coupling factor transporter transmembrane protein EcfT [Streptococcaceae bacterium]
MMDKLILGRYIPIDSLIHRMDPRAKMLATFFFIVIIFLANNFAAFFVLTVLTLTAIIASRISFSFFLRGVKPMLLLILLTVGLQMIFTVGGKVYFKFGFIQITQFGLENSALIFLRFILIIFFSTLLTLTTAPLEMSDAFESLMNPLKRFKVPVHEISLMLSISLRFVPTLMDETEKIMNAQRSRGVDFGEGSLIQKVKAIIPLLIPLFVSSFKRADELATAMEARGYQGGEGRTRYRKLEWKLRDTAVLLILAVVTVLLILVRK